ncbi:MAG: hypothetical protein R3250_18100 [Melioribacteraceae bacterium]|nr:hypothetical protein [Melioribacteraceae bacterium]
MLTFFRRIRKGLLGSGQTQKYILYALGEIALVVIGILIALQINNWNEERKERIKENKILNDLIENLEFNTDNLNKIIADFTADNGSSDLIISVIENKRKYHDSLDYHFARALNVSPLYPISYVAYETMKNSGFDIVHNDQLKKEIVNLFELTYTTMQLRQNNTSDLWEFHRQHFMIAPNGWSFKPFDFEELIADREFQSLINVTKSGRWWILQAYNESLQETQRVLQLVKDELREN